MPLYDRTAGVVRAIYASRIATPATLEPEHYFPNAKRFAERWADIRREALAVAGTLGKVSRFHDVWRRDTPADIALLSRAILLGTQAVIRMGGMPDVG